MILNITTATQHLLLTTVLSIATKTIKDCTLYDIQRPLNVNVYY